MAYYYYAKEITKFQGKLNNVELNDEYQYEAVQKILDEIEDIYRNRNDFESELYFPDNFISDVASELEKMYSEYENETSYPEIAYEVSNDLWFEKEDLSDLTISYMRMKQWFTQINNHLVNQRYDFKTPVKVK